MKQILIEVTEEEHARLTNIKNTHGRLTWREMLQIAAEHLEEMD